MQFSNPPISTRKSSNSEVLARNGAITGHVNCCYKLGIDQSTGDLYYRDLNSIWQPIPGGGGGSTERFGFSGEDDTAGENRAFDLVGNDFLISDSNLGTDILSIDTTNYQSLFNANDGTAFSQFVLNGDLVGNNVQFAITTTDNLNFVQITGDAISKIINLGADNGIQINSAYTLPLVDGTAGQVMTTDGAGVASWEDGGIGSPSAIDWAVLAILNTPSGTTNTGDIFLAGSSPTGAFVGHANEIATSTNPGYTFQTASIGDLLYDLSTDTVYKYTGTGWILVGRLTLHQGGDTYGVPIVMGSRDNFNVTFRVNNVYAGSIGTSATYNTSLGILSLPASATGIHNTALGSGASGQNTTGTQNTSVGYTSNYNNTTGNQNTGVGWAAIGFNIGTGNTAVGYSALNTTVPSVRTARYNTAIGWEALQNNLDHEYNIGLGVQAGQLDKFTLAPIAKDATLYVSSWTNHMYFPLDSDDVTPDFLIGRDNDNFWHSYPASGFTGGGGSATASNGLSINGGDVVWGAFGTDAPLGFSVSIDMNGSDIRFFDALTNTVSFVIDGDGGGAGGGIEISTQSTSGARTASISLESDDGISPTRAHILSGDGGSGDFSKVEVSPSTLILTSPLTRLATLAGSGTGVVGINNTGDLFWTAGGATASNGLDISGGDVILGGFLTEGTNIDLAGFSLQLSYSSQVNFSIGTSGGASSIDNRTTSPSGDRTAGILINSDDGATPTTTQVSILSRDTAGGDFCEVNVGMSLLTFSAPQTRISELAGNGVGVIAVDNNGDISWVGNSSGVVLQVDGTPNVDQLLLNLVAGTNITLTDDGVGGVTIDSAGGGGGNTIYTASDSITSNRIVDLAGHTLTLSDLASGGSSLVINPSTVTSTLAAIDSGGGITTLTLIGDTNNAVSFDLKANFTGNGFVEIFGDAFNLVTTYTSPRHIFNGSALQITMEDGVGETDIRVNGNPSDGYNFNFEANNGTNDVVILGDSVSNTISYTAGVHIFNNFLQLFSDAPSFEGQLFVTDNINGSSTLVLVSDSAGNNVSFDLASFGTNIVEIKGDAMTANSLDYIAGTHTFTGRVIGDVAIADDFINDAAAATGGVPVGCKYHTTGVVKIRLV